MGEKVRASLISLRDLLATAWPIVLVVAIGFIIAVQFIKPAPPRHVVMSTGADSGAYYAFGKKYAEILARSGITLEVRTSAGSAENLQRLLDKESDVEIALVQGGVEPPRPAAADGEAAPEALPLEALGSMYYEPVWVFYRGSQDLERLHQLAGKRIAVGAEGSGIRGLALQLLAANEIALDSPLIHSLGGLKAAEALQQGRIDAAFVIAAPEAPVVQVLLRSPGIKVMNFAQAEAYTRRFPYLSKIVLPEGAVDLVRNFPPHDTTLLAATANLVVHDSLHPAIQSLLLQAAGEVHGKAGFFQRRGDFPAVKDQSFPVADTAERHYKSGPPFLQRYLPFWAAILVDRLVVLLLPVFALLLPLLKVAPSLYSWRVRSKIFRCYGDLKFLENEIKEDYDPGRKLEYLDRLDRIEEAAYRRNIPLAYSDLLYTLREHIELVRHTLDRLGHPDRSPTVEETS
jgi:TRAP transporter TAXI family solute receptor